MGKEMNTKSNEVIFDYVDPKNPFEPPLALRISSDDKGNWLVSISPKNEEAKHIVRISPDDTAVNAVPGLANAIKGVHTVLESNQAEDTMIHNVNKLFMKFGIIAIWVGILINWYADITGMVTWVMHEAGYTGLTRDSFIVWALTVMFSTYVICEIGLRQMAFLQNNLPRVFGKKKMFLKSVQRRQKN